MSENAITRILAWLRSIIVGRPKQAAITPLFRTVQEIRWDNGLLWQVEVDKKQRPNEVLTYLFIPFRQPGKTTPDWLVTCDLIDGRGGRVANTHQISVISIPHFARDFSGAQVSYSAPWDLQGRSPYRNSYVRCILFRVATRLRLEDAAVVDWHVAIATARTECWGGVPVPATPQTPGGGDIWVQPYDPGTKRVRVRMRWALLWVSWLLYES